MIVFNKVNKNYGTNVGLKNATVHGILQEARLDSGRRNQGNFRPFHHHDHAVGNGSNRTGNHV